MAYIDELAHSAALSRRARRVTEKPSLRYRIVFCTVVYGIWLLILEVALRLMPA